MLGATPGADAAAIQLGFDLLLTPRAVVKFGYDGSFSSRGQNHAFRGGLDWKF